MSLADHKMPSLANMFYLEKELGARGSNVDFIAGESGCQF